jgi:hypothetical protein
MWTVTGDFSSPEVGGKSLLRPSVVVDIPAMQEAEVGGYRLRPAWGKNS